MPIRLGRMSLCLNSQTWLLQRELCLVIFNKFVEDGTLQGEGGPGHNAAVLGSVGYLDSLTQSWYER